MEIVIQISSELSIFYYNVVDELEKNYSVYNLHISELRLGFIDSDQVSFRRRVGECSDLTGRVVLVNKKG